MHMASNALHAIFETEGVECYGSTGKPVWLNGSDHHWLVVGGNVDVFLTHMLDGQPTGALHPLFRAEADSLLLGVPQLSREGWGMVAVGLSGSRLLKVRRERLQGDVQAHSGDLGPAAKCLERWIDQLVAQSPMLVPNTETCLVSREGWLSSIADDDWHAVSSGDYLRWDRTWASLDDLHAKLLTQIAFRIQATQANEQQRWARQQSVDAKNFQNALYRLSAILGGDRDSPGFVAETCSPLLAACQLIGRASGITFVQPSTVSSSDALGEIIEATRVRKRQVVLNGDWWNLDHGHMLARLVDGDHPVALLHTSGGYVLSNPLEGTQIPVDQATAAKVGPIAYVFYRPFASNTVGLLDLVRLGSHGNLQDYIMAVLIGLAVGLLGVVTPMATGLLFDTVIPSSDKSQWLQLTIALLAGTLATAMFELTRGYAMLRVEGRMDSAIQAAVWDRLLRLPTSFFRDYSAGDLALRANGINTIRQALSGNTVHTLMALAFSFFNLGLLFYYNVKLALLAVALVTMAVLFTTTASVIRLHHERKLQEIEGRISGVLFQLLGGISKLRTTGSEGRAFFNWAMLFAGQQEYLFKATMVRNAIGVFNSVYSSIANMCIFAAIAFFLSNEASFSTGAFLAFNAAFGGFLGAMLGASGAFTAVLDIIPVYERSKPILLAFPETSGDKSHPGVLSGDIELSHLCFSYSADGPPILRDLSLHIKAGEFVAVVGASGSGKSTLLRLLLGFESPSTGSIYYDRQDMAGLDLGALRRQLGVVLQNGQLMSGDIYSNIVGSATSLGLDDAWTAARQAGIADDIQAMPMGMHTVVSDGGGTLSGGQRQRLLIARAIVSRPRILFFDEATSALDNRTQATVSDSLENLSATRVVIAHRLSTIINADRIFVLDRGQLVQTGTYDELVNCDGLFADLVHRQMV